MDPAGHTMSHEMLCAKRIRRRAQVAPSKLRGLCRHLLSRLRGLSAVGASGTVLPMPPTQGQGSPQVEPRIDTALLIRLATHWGYPEVGSRRLQTFRSEGLLPSPPTVGWEGQTPIKIYPPHTPRQLRSLLYWQEKTKNHDELRVVMWLEGYPIELHRVQTSVVELLQQHAQVVDLALAGLRLTTKAFGRVARMRAIAERALRQRKNPFPLMTGSRLSARIDGLTSLMMMFAFGEGPTDQTAEHAEMIESVLGLDQGARTRRIDGTDPWLTGPATDLFDAAEYLNLPALIEVAKTATEEELIEARCHVVALFRYLPFLLRGFSLLVKSRNPIGLGLLNTLDERPNAVPWLIAAVIAMHRIGWNTQLMSVTESMETAPQLALETAELAKLPDVTFAKNVASSPKRGRARARRLRQAAVDGTLTMPGPPSPAKQPKSRRSGESP